MLKPISPVADSDVRLPETPTNMSSTPFREPDQTLQWKLWNYDLDPAESHNGISRNPCSQKITIASAIFSQRHVGNQDIFLLHVLTSKAILIFLISAAGCEENRHHIRRMIELTKYSHLKYSEIITSPACFWHLLGTTA